MARCAALLIVFCSPVAAAAKSVPRHFISHAKENDGTDRHYFVEFRARPGLLVGHTFIAYGRMSHGRFVRLHYAGIYPRDEHAGLIIGSVIPVPASVRAVEGDFQEAPSAIYRRKLTAAEFVRLKRAVRQEEAIEQPWHIVFSNCNDFAIRIARVIDLRTPPSLLLPKDFVGELDTLNGH